MVAGTEMDVLIGFMSACLFTADIVVMVIQFGMLKALNSDAFDGQHRERLEDEELDDRFLGFHFTEEPTNTVAKAGRIELNCRYTISMRNTSSRTEWRKDGAELGSLRPTGKM
ncbi:hypothetical protein WUBG_03778 [Wuchereria bancrofti]|uniref:Uncharacterized protein n=1 Tax=Wuchereria bancrofti TaxID=6293 RepID=J9BDN3_WUCBA|nr:hypothetical protein WUBG_03778 [Wuchereria bancrofti]VDM07343.1 unnamed protein product [Wuchereria bancrofti]